MQGVETNAGGMFAGIRRNTRTHQQAAVVSRMRLEPASRHICERCGARSTKIVFRDNKPHRCCAPCSAVTRGGKMTEAQSLQRIVAILKKQGLA